jgi:hypothetical protein
VENPEIIDAEDSYGLMRRCGEELRAFVQRIHMIF